VSASVWKPALRRYGRSINIKACIRGPPLRLVARDSFKIHIAARMNSPNRAGCHHAALSNNLPLALPKPPDFSDWHPFLFSFTVSLGSKFPDKTRPIVAGFLPKAGDFWAGTCSVWLKILRTIEAIAAGSGAESWATAQRRLAGENPAKVQGAVSFATSEQSGAILMGKRGGTSLGRGGVGFQRPR